MSAFGPLFSAHLIEEGALKVLREWLPTYVAEVERQYGLQLPAIESWGLTDVSKLKPENAKPALFVAAEDVSRGGKPSKNAGFYRAGWPLGVTVVVQHPKPHLARKTAQLYAAVTRGVLLQRRSLGDAGRVAEWVGEDYPMSIGKDRTRVAAENVFVVTQDEVVNWKAGPKGDEPPAVPPVEPEVTEVDVDMEAE